MRNSFLLALIIAGCSVETPKVSSPDAAVSVDAPPASPDAPEAIVDRNCTDVKARLGTATDGAHWIDPDLDGPRAPIRVFCGAMTTATPKEYLELVKVSPPTGTPAANYSTYAMGVPHASWTCNCGISTTVYSKVRIDPATLVVNVDDTTFGVFADSTDVACMQTKLGCPSGPTRYAVASSCVTNLDASGRANVDLTGLPFHIAGTASEGFFADGFTPAGAVAIDAARKIASITGGGDCGNFGAAAGLALEVD